jgi:excinuclease UvrABC nuclease subunit
MKTIQGQHKTYQINQNDCFWCIITRPPGKLDESDIQNKCGVYIFLGAGDIPLRIGIATKLRNRIQSYDRASNWYVFSKMYPYIESVCVIYTNTQIEAQNIEKDLITKQQPAFNYRHLNCFEIR